MKKTKDPRLFLILSMVIFGSIAIFVRHLPLPSSEIALCRSVMAAMPVGLYLLLTKQLPDIKRLGRQLPLLMLSGAALGINWILLFEAYKYTTVSTATLCYYFAPIIVTLVSLLLFREKLTWLQVLCFVMSTAGLALITGIGNGEVGGKGVALGLGAAIFYASVVLLNKHIKGVSGLQRTFLQFSAAALVILPYVSITDGFHITSLSGKEWGILIAVGLIHTALAYCLYFSAVGSLPGQQIAILSYIDPLVAVLASVFVLGEKISLIQMIGGALILVFSLINELIADKKRSAINNE